MYKHIAITANLLSMFVMDNHGRVSTIAPCVKAGAPCHLCASSIIMAAMEQKFYIETYGCRVNQCESQAIIEGWQRSGYELTAHAEDADYIIINSCAITARAERDARNALTRLRKLAPRAFIILTGCAAQFYMDFQPRKNAPWTRPDICIPQTEKSGLLGGPQSAAPAELFPLIRSGNRARPVVKIQDGCTQHCTYCIVPQTRGRPHSMKPADILDQCRQLAAEGFGELVISGINLRQYAGNFWQMVSWLDNELAEEFAPGLRLRLSSLDPSMLTAEAVDVLGNSRLLCPHLHLSLQHASPTVLAAMGRKHYTLDSVAESLQRLRTFWPVMGLGADFIVGFPGETDDDVNTLLGFITSFPLTYAHVFPYSRRQGTKAAALPGQLPRKIKEARAQMAREAVARKQLLFLEKQLGLPVVNMVVERRSGEFWHGVNEYYSPCQMARDAVERQPMLGGRPQMLKDGILTLQPQP